MSLISKATKEGTDILLEVIFRLETWDPYISSAKVDHVVRTECGRFYGETFSSKVSWKIINFEAFPKRDEVELTLQVPANCVTHFVSCLSFVSSYLENRSVFVVRDYSQVSA